MDCRSQHPSNALDDISFRPSENSTCLKFVHSKKAASLIIWTLLGIFMLFSPLQVENAATPMPFTLLGIVELQQPFIRQLSLVLIIALQSSRESYVGLFSSTDMDVRKSESKAKTPMYFTLDGMYICFRLLQPSKANSPMCVMLLGISMSVSVSQFEKACESITVVLYSIP